MIEEKIFRLSEEKLTNAERQIICLLKKAGAKTNKEISDLLGKDQGNISKKMKSLLEKGFVTVRKYHKGTSNFKEYSLVNFELDIDLENEGRKIYKAYYVFIQFFNEEEDSPKILELERIKSSDKLQKIFKSIYERKLF